MAAEVCPAIKEGMTFAKTLPIGKSESTACSKCQLAINVLRTLSGDQITPPTNCPIAPRETRQENLQRRHHEGDL